MTSVYTMEIGNCYRSQLHYPKLCSVQLCCCSTQSTGQLDLFCKDKQETELTVVPTVCQQGGETGASHLELMFSTHTELQCLYCCVTYHLTLVWTLSKCSRHLFFSSCTWSPRGLYCNRFCNTLPFTQNNMKNQLQKNKENDFHLTEQLWKI